MCNTQCATQFARRTAPDIRQLHGDSDGVHFGEPTNPLPAQDLVDRRTVLD